MGKHRNYTKYSTSEYDVVNEEIVDITVESIEETIPEKRGVVTNCTKLNVREAPCKTAPAICTIGCLTEVIIVNEYEDAGDEFYHIYTESGIEGFCMKKFIALR